MSIRLPIAFVILIQALALLPTRAAAQCPSPIVEGTTSGVIKFNTVKAQMWFNDGLWWGAFSDNDSGIHFYTFSGGAAIQGPVIDADTNGIPDVLWDDTNLFVLIRKSAALSTLYKYAYDSGAKSYSLIDGFPIGLTLKGRPSSAVVLDEDNTGKLWATYTGTQGDSSDGQVHVIWSTSADHTEWDTNGITLESGLDPNKLESSAIIHFGGDKIGIVWSNQPLMEIAFRYHIDGQAETQWSEKEVIDSGLGPRGLGPVANDHLNIKAAPDGRIFLVAKDNDDNGTPNNSLEGQVWLYIRSAVGVWGQKTLVQQDSSQLPTRPILLLDVTNNVAYVIYHDDSAAGGQRNFITQASMDNPSFDFSCVFTTTSASNPTSTKQNLTFSSGLMVAGSTGGSHSELVFGSIELDKPVPTVTGLSPASAFAGGVSLSLTVYGNNFINGSVVRFNGSNRSTSFVSSTQLTAQITAADIQSAGIASVGVFNPLPGGGESNALDFTVNNLTPTLTSLSQSSAMAGAAAFTLTVQGSNFVNGSVVRFNGNNHTTSFVSSTQLTVQITAADIQSAGTASVSVFNPLPGGGQSNSLGFTVNNLTPTLTSLSQSSATAGDAAFTLTVQGSNFVNGSVVRFNGSDRNTSFVSSTQLTAQITAADVLSVGTASVSVFNPLPGGGQSNALNFTINVQPAKIQFTSSNYTVNEGSGSLEITVNRTGDSSQAITVDYATDDGSVEPCMTVTGSASQRCDYVKTGGRLSLAAGETSKSFTVLLYEDVYVEGNETFGITLSNAMGATLGTLSTITVTIQDNDVEVATSNPIDDARFFVNRHYLDLLHRLPDQDGLDYWTHQITNCGADEACIRDKRIGVSAAFFVEQEFQQTGFAVYRLHKAAYGQRPAYARFMRDRGQLVGGPQLQASTQVFADRFVNRVEFKQAYPDGMTPSDFVNKVFDAAGLVPNATERAQQIAAMTNSGKTRAQVLLDVIEIQQFKSKEYDPAFVLMQYFGYLRRDPDQGGYDFWLNVLNNKAPGNYRAMVCAFITSSEYQQRTSAVVTRSNHECGP
jgi:hypothetical protein